MCIEKGQVKLSGGNFGKEKNENWWSFQFSLIWFSFTLFFARDTTKKSKERHWKYLILHNQPTWEKFLC